MGVTDERGVVPACERAAQRRPDAGVGLRSRHNEPTDASLGEHRFEVGVGDVRVGCGRGSVVSVKAISGDVRIGLTAGIRVEPDISTLSGQTSLPTPSSQPTVDDQRRVRVRLRSVSGDIGIDRVDA